VLVQALEVRSRRHEAPARDQHGLDQADEAGRGLQVAEIGLHRGERAVRGGLPGEPPLLVELGERLNESAGLNGIAQSGAGAVRLNHPHGSGIDLSLPPGFEYHPLLGLGRRRGQRNGAAAVVDGRSQDHRPDEVSLRARGRGPLEIDGGDAFPARVAVGPGVERLAGAVAGEHADVLERRGRGGVQHQADAAHDRCLAIARRQRGDRPVERGQGTRAGGVHRLARTSQIEQERDPIGEQ
jgi:hypothetical protein